MSVTQASARETFRPESAADVADIVRHALSRDISLDVTGAGTKRALGRPAESPHILSLAALSGIVKYEPEELVLTVHAATPMREIAALLASRRQMLAFEPPDYGPVLGAAADRATLGGIVAANASGPRRLKAGAARDHTLGVSAISGRGEAFVAGGRVVKNVTGYDIPKLLAGSYGTLAVLTEVTVKLLPLPEAESTLVLRGLDDESALQAMTAALQSACDVSCAAHLHSGLSLDGRALEQPLTALRLEGFRPSVLDRLASLTQIVGGETEVLEGDASRSLWQEVRDLTPFMDAPIIWRVSCPPAQSAQFTETIVQSHPSVRALYDWGCALIWLALDGGDAHESLVRGAAASAGGHAILFKAPRDLRSAIEVFPPLATPLRDLTLRVKQQFDPRRVLNRGRMYDWA